MLRVKGLGFRVSEAFIAQPFQSNPFQRKPFSGILSKESSSGSLFGGSWVAISGAISSTVISHIR